MLLCYPLVYNFSVELTNLEEYDFYYIQVTAMNVIGNSPLSPNITVQTEEAREFDTVRTRYVGLRILHVINHG